MQPPVAEAVVGASELLVVVGAVELAAALAVPAWLFVWQPPRLVAVGAEPPVAVEATRLVVAGREWLPVAAAVVEAVGDAIVPPPDETLEFGMKTGKKQQNRLKPTKRNYFKVTNHAVYVLTHLLCPFLFLLLRFPFENCCHR